jgi:AcrR family transcriptional regulator
LEVTHIRESRKDKTRLSILISGKKEFLSKGFQKASLRIIAKNAGLTTGAVYRHFKDKNHLFESLVSEVTKEMETMFEGTKNKFFNSLEIDETRAGPDLPTERLKRLTDYVYANFDDFKLLLTGAEGSTLEDFANRLVNLNAEHPEPGEAVEGHGSVTDATLLRVLNKICLNSVFETVILDMPREAADSYVDNLAVFLNAGLEGLARFRSAGSHGKR